MNEKIGEFSSEVISLLNLNIPVGTGIFIGETNIAHMLKTHPYEFHLFFDQLSYIISNADFVRLRVNDNSIEFIKEFGKYIKLAVRIAGDGKYYARSLYFIETNRVENLLKTKKLKQLTKRGFGV